GSLPERRNPSPTMARPLSSSRLANVVGAEIPQANKRFKGHEIGLDQCVPRRGTLDRCMARFRWVDQGREGTRLVFAVTSSGRYLFVVVTQAADGRDFIVTARDMTNSEKRTFREKGR